MLANEGRVIGAACNQGAIDKIPVNEECALQGIDHSARKSYHGVAPGLLLGTFHVAEGDVHTTDIACLPVDDYQFAVVAVVGLAGEHGEMDWIERDYIDACHTHALKEAVLDLPTAYVVVNDAYLNSFASLGNKGVGNELTQSIVLEDVDVDMDVVPGLGNILEEFGEEGVTVGHDVNHVVLERQ